MSEVWTSRDVHFKVFPRTSSELREALMDAAVDHYWDTWREQLLRTTLSVSSCNGTLEIGGWPWWVPAWLARRSVASLAAATGVGGSARYVVERTVLT